jgi:divalent metal cation (Fe/Co/Zn/Cd) transporter
MTIASADDRAALVRQAFWLEWLTIAWLAIEAGVALWSGSVAGSITLLAFGLDSVIELISAGILIWRLTVELRHGQEFSEEAEQRASKIGGALLFALAAYVVIGAVWSLWTKRAEEFSTPGLQIGSRALRADAVESIACGWLSVMVVAGLTAQYLIGAWWIDAVTSLGIVWFLVREGREAWKGEECGDACH